MSFLASQTSNRQPSLYFQKTRHAIFLNFCGEVADLKKKNNSILKFTLLSSISPLPLLASGFNPNPKLVASVKFSQRVNRDCSVAALWSVYFTIFLNVLIRRFRRSRSLSLSSVPLYRLSHSAKFASVVVYFETSFTFLKLS